MPTRSSKKALPAVEPYIVRVAEWKEMVEGDAVKVSAPLLEGKRGYKWEFRCHATNTLAGTTWIEVYGGNKQHHGLRAFKPEQVTLIPKRVRRQCRDA